MVLRRSILLTASSWPPSRPAQRTWPQSSDGRPQTAARSSTARRSVGRRQYEDRRMK
jgi:hypothetical protein